MAVSASAVAEVEKLAMKLRMRLEETKTDFMNKDALGLRWDSMVPCDEISLWRLFTLSASDKISVVKEISYFINFYTSIANMSSLDFDGLENLDQEVVHAMNRAKEQIRITNSKTIFNMCRELLYGNIGDRIAQIRDEIATYEYKNLRGNLDEIVKTEAEKWKKRYKNEIEELRRENVKEVEEIESMKTDFQTKFQKLSDSLSTLKEAAARVLKPRKGVEADSITEQSLSFEESPLQETQARGRLLEAIESEEMKKSTEKWNTQLETSEQWEENIAFMYNNTPNGSHETKRSVTEKIMPFEELLLTVQLEESLGESEEIMKQTTEKSFQLESEEDFVCTIGKTVVMNEKEDPDEEVITVTKELPPQGEKKEEKLLEIIQTEEKNSNHKKNSKLNKGIAEEEVVTLCDNSIDINTESGKSNAEEVMLVEEWPVQNPQTLESKTAANVTANNKEDTRIQSVDL